MPSRPTTTLAQLGDFINPAVPALPKPPALERFLFEAPLLPCIGLLLVGIIALVMLRNAGKARAGLIIAGSSVLLAVAVWLTAANTLTERERVLIQQDDMVAAVASAELDQLESLLGLGARMPRVNLPVVSGGLDREGIINAVRRTTGAGYPVRDVAIIERQAVIDGPNAARTQIYLRVESEAAGGTFAWFRMAWRLEPDSEWRAIEIEPLFMSGILPYKD